MIRRQRGDLRWARPTPSEVLTVPTARRSPSQASADCFIVVWKTRLSWLESPNQPLLESVVADRTPVVRASPT